MSSFEVLEQFAHHSSHAARILDQIVLFINGDVCQRSSTRKRVAVISQPTVEHILLKVIRNPASHTDCAELHVCTRQTFCHRDQIRNDFPVIDREPLSGTTETSHYLVSDQKNAVLVTKSAQALHVTVRRNENAVGADNGLDDQRGDRLWSFKLQHFFSTCKHFFSRVPTFLNAVIVVRETEHAGDAGLGGPTARIAC